MSRTFERRAPKRNGGFSWGRVVGENTVEYRLFRRDHRGALHTSITVFARNTPIQQMAKDIRRKCHLLRDKVDEIDLKAWGIAA